MFWLPILKDRKSIILKSYKSSNLIHTWFVHMMHLQLKCWAITFLIMILTLDRWHKIINDYEITCCNAKEHFKQHDDTFALFCTCAIILTSSRWNHSILVARLFIIIIIVYQVFLCRSENRNFVWMQKNKRAYNLDLSLAKRYEILQEIWLESF